MKLLTLFFFILLPLAFSLANVIHVPVRRPHYPTGYRPGPDRRYGAGGRGDLLWRDISFKGKYITVASEFILDSDTSHISKTTINGNQNANSVVRFVTNEDTNSVLSGFTITGGQGSPWERYPGQGNGYGGGIHIYNSGAKITYNKITGNNLTDEMGMGGAGILADVPDDKVVIFENNIIATNSASGSGWIMGVGIALFGWHGGHFIVHKNTIRDNTCTGEYEDIIGIGIFCRSEPAQAGRNNNK